MSQEKTYTVYTYSPREERLNVWSHFIGIILSVVALVMLLLKASEKGDIWGYVSFTVYGLSMLTLYLASTLYHSSRKPKLRYFLNIFDHAAIYLFIAGSYTPFVLLTLKGTQGWVIFAIVWSIAIVGVLFKLFFTGRFNLLSTVLYVLMGWIIVFSLKSLSQNLAWSGLVWLFAGGLAYTLGAVFYSISRLKLNHFIFHFFVLVGSFCHFISIYGYVMP